MMYATICGEIVESGANMAERKILVVDDQRPIRKSCREALEAISGYTIYEAGTAREGRKIHLKEKMDLILVDYLMPLGNGMGMIAKLRADGDETLMIIMADSESENLRICAENLRAGYLGKPFEKRDLVERVTHYLGDK